MKDNVENVCSSSTDPNICTTAIFANSKNSKKKCCKIWEAYRVCQSQVKGLTWNGASIVTIALDFIVILKVLDCMSRALTDRMARQILVPARCELAFEILTSSNSFSKH